MKQIGDDPIVRCIERSGYPPWYFPGGIEYDERDGETGRGKDEDGKL